MFLSTKYDFKDQKIDKVMNIKKQKYPNNPVSESNSK